MSEEKPAPPSSSSPLLLGFVGLLLILGGWKLTTWVPPSHDDALFNEVRRLADDGLRAKLDGYRRPPLELPGRLALFAGLGLFVVAGVKMYRAPAAPAEVEDNPHGISSPSAPTKADAHL